MTVLEAVAESVIQSYRNNKSMGEIAKVYGCSIGTVRNFLIAKGEPRRPKGRPKKAAATV